MSSALHRRFDRALMPALLGLASLGLSPVLPAAEHPVLRIYNWEVYLDPDLVAEFGRRHGVRVQETYFESDTERDRRLAASQGTGFDLVIVDTASVSVYRERGWLAPIGERQVPGIARMHSKWRGAPTEATSSHAFPYAWGTLGIGYRADLVRAAPDSWLQLFNPDATLCGKLQISSNARELVAVALKAGGASANSTDPADYQRAERLVRAQRPCVASYRATAFDQEAPLVTGRAIAAMVYGTDVVRMLEHNPNIRFVMPREGGILFADYVVVLASSTRKPLAYQFLQFLTEPPNAARQSLFMKTATPNVAGQALLAEKIRTDGAIYPDARDLAAAERIQRTTPVIQSKINQIFARIVPQE